MKFRSRYGKYRLVLHPDNMVLTTDGKSIFVAGGKEGVPGTIAFQDYEYRPKNKKEYDAIAEAWNHIYGEYPEDTLAIHDSSIEIPRGLSAQETEIFMEGVQKRQAEGKLMPNPGVDFWEVDPAATGAVAPQKKIGVNPGVRTTIPSEG